MKLKKNICEDCCKGKRISELDEKVDIQGTEYIPFQEGNDNGKFSLGSLKDYLIKLIEEYLINNGIIREDWVQSEPAYKLLATLPELIADRACKDEFGNNINDTYLTRDAVKTYIQSIYEDLFTENPPHIMDGYITVDMLSEAVLQLLNSGGAITNFPDEEDLTVKDGKLKFNDKEYDPNKYSGLGRVMLRRNMVDGVNVLTQEMMSKPNTCYIIQYDYDLRGETITIPEGCVLQFEGGSLSNGTINGNNTIISASLVKIFNTNITISGTWNVEEAYPEWFGAIGDGVYVCTNSIQQCINYFDVIRINKGTYVTEQLNLPSYKAIIGYGIESVLKANPNMEESSSFLLRTENGGSRIIIKDLTLLCGESGTVDDVRIGGIGLISSSNEDNKVWDTSNLIENVIIRNTYAASIYMTEFHRETKIVNCIINYSTNYGIYCDGTDNMISGCTISNSHNSGIYLNTNNRVSNVKLFGCGISDELTNVYALDIVGNKCNVSNVDIQQNIYGGVVIRGNSNYVQVVNDNNGSGNPNGTNIGANISGSYNTIIITAYNFSFHNDAFEKYYVSTGWNTMNNTIVVNGPHLNNNKMNIFSPWTRDNITNTLICNGYNITEASEISFPTTKNVWKYIQYGTGSINVKEGNIIFNIKSATSAVNNCIQAVINIPSEDIDPDGVISAKMLFNKQNDINSTIYPYAEIVTSYLDSQGQSKERVDKCNIINNFDNKDVIIVTVLSSLHHANLDIVKINDIKLNISLGSTSIISDIDVTGTFTNILIGAKKTDGTIINLLKDYGDSNSVPNSEEILRGYSYYNTDYNRYQLYNGLQWLNSDGTLTSKVTII